MIDEPLEPPGTIAVIGAGPLGLEAALYGRFLGYEVTVFEAGRVAERWRDEDDAPLPFSPSRGLSPLASSAVQTHHQSGGAPPRGLPMTVRAWIEQSLETLAESDLLDGRVQTHCRVVRLSLAPVAEDDQRPPSAEAAETFEAAAEDEGPEGVGPEDEGPVPADFLVQVQRQDGVRETIRVEAVIDTTEGRGGAFGYEVPDGRAFAPLGDQAEDGDFRTGVAYFYRINAAAGDQPSGWMPEAGWDRIRRLYAMLGDRSSLDLYRPLRQ